MRIVADEGVRITLKQAQCGISAHPDLRGIGADPYSQIFP